MRALLVLASLGMLIAATGSGLAAALAKPDVKYVFVGETADGTLVSYALDRAALDHATQCGGTAPLVTSCNNGQHTPANGPTSYTHGFVFPTVAGPFGDYVGSVQSTISDGVSTRVFTCTTALGSAGISFGGVPPVWGCSGVGTKPSGTFTQHCRSLFPDTQLASPVEGGAGDWLCIVQGANGYPAP